MRAPAILLLLALLPLAACERLLEDATPDLDTVRAETVESVVDDVLARLAAARDETGPRFYGRLPEIKDAAAARAGFEDWAEFGKRLDRTDPALPAAVSARITERMRELLEGGE